MILMLSTQHFSHLSILINTVWKAAALRDGQEDFRKLSKLNLEKVHLISVSLKRILQFIVSGSMAKYAASRCATSNANNCVQILGAKGFVSGDAERYYRDSRITQIYGGASDIQKLIIAELILKE